MWKIRDYPSPRWDSPELQLKRNLAALDTLRRKQGQFVR